MQIDKQQIIDFLKSRGEGDKAQQAEAKLPQQVDPEEQQGLLQELGIDPQDLIKNLDLGGLGGKLGL